MPTSDLCDEGTPNTHGRCATVCKQLHTSASADQSWSTPPETPAEAVRPVSQVALQPSVINTPSARTRGALSTSYMQKNSQPMVNRVTTGPECACATESDPLKALANAQGPQPEIAGLANASHSGINQPSTYNSSSSEEGRAWPSSNPSSSSPNRHQYARELPRHKGTPKLRSHVATRPVPP